MVISQIYVSLLKLTGSFPSPMAVLESEKIKNKMDIQMQRSSTKFSCNSWWIIVFFKSVYSEVTGYSYLPCSAYSIFNEDFRELPGTLNADRIDRDIRAGQFWALSGWIATIVCWDLYRSIVGLCLSLCLENTFKIKIVPFSKSSEFAVCWRWEITSTLLKIS